MHVNVEVNCYDRGNKMKDCHYSLNMQYSTVIVLQEHRYIYIYSETQHMLLHNYDFAVLLCHFDLIFPISICAVPHAMIFIRRQK